MPNERVFWADGINGGKGGYYFRAGGLAAFIKRCEEDGFTVAGIAFDLDDPNLCQLILQPKEAKTR